MHVPAKNFGMDGQIWRARKQNINIFTFRWYLVFLIFVIRGLMRSEQATFTAGNMFVTLNSMHVPAKNFCMDCQIWRARKQNINIFTFRWYLVFLIFVIRGLRRSKQATFTAGNVFVTLDSSVRSPRLNVRSPRLPLL